MADQFPLVLQPAESPIPRRRGRPPGARNKRSIDLARFVEATFGGMTPGQQAAELCLARPGEIARARADAQELGIIDLDVPKPVLALVVKAHRLAKALGISRAEAWLLMTKERAELMPYIHQRLPAAAEDKSKVPATVFMIPEGVAAETEQLVGLSTSDEDEAFEILGEIVGGGQPVGNGQSDD